MSGKYEDILHLPHPDSPKHPRMSLYDRAAQFSPFAALTGHSAAIAETGRLTDIMTLAAIRTMDQPAVIAKAREELKQKNGGSYQTVIGSVKRIDAVNGVIQMTDWQCIPIADVFSIEIIQ